MAQRTVADFLAASLKAAGVQRLFGMPGGGSNSDLLEAAENAGLPFTLAHTESASAFMACAQAEITGAPGACMATLGPGAASLMNGVAHAFLDRVPLIVITDCHADASAAGIGHQALPQRAMFEPIVKYTSRIEPRDAPEKITEAIDAAWEGPVHLELTTETACAPCDATVPAPRPRPFLHGYFLPESRRPVFLVGLGARAAGLSETCERLHIPALVTYKAKGMIPDRHPWFAGVLTNGALERKVLERADSFLTIGLDEVELLPRPWNYAPRYAMPPFHAPDRIPVADWDVEEVRRLAEEQRAAMRVAADDEGIAPYRVVELAAEAYAGARSTVDAGAHMFPVLSLWPASRPRDVLISNGLSTMGFALPSAIGAALLERDKPVVAFTGDGGLLMCAAELRTSAREGLPLRIIVFDDRELSLIKVKQEQRGYRTEASEMGPVDWASLACALGVAARSAATDEELEHCFAETRAIRGPVLIAARVNPAAYRETIRILRG